MFRFGGGSPWSVPWQVETAGVHGKRDGQSEERTSCPKAGQGKGGGKDKGA